MDTVPVACPLAVARAALAEAGWVAVPRALVVGEREGEGEGSGEGLVEAEPETLPLPLTLGVGEGEGAGEPEAAAEAEGARVKEGHCVAVEEVLWEVLRVPVLHAMELELRLTVPLREKEGDALTDLERVPEGVAELQGEALGHCEEEGDPEGLGLAWPDTEALADAEPVSVMLPVEVRAAAEEGRAVDEAVPQAVRVALLHTLALRLRVPVEDVERDLEGVAVLLAQGEPVPTLLTLRLMLALALLLGLPLPLPDRLSDPVEEAVAQPLSAPVGVPASDSEPPCEALLVLDTVTVEEELWEVLRLPVLQAVELVLRLTVPLREKVVVELTEGDRLPDRVLEGDELMLGLVEPDGLPDALTEAELQPEPLSEALPDSVCKVLCDTERLAVVLGERLWMPLAVRVALLHTLALRLRVPVEDVERERVGLGVREALRAPVTVSDGLPLMLKDSQLAEEDADGEVEGTRVALERTEEEAEALPVSPRRSSGARSRSKIICI